MKDVKLLGESVFYGVNKIGSGSIIFNNCVFGFPEGSILKKILEEEKDLKKSRHRGTIIGKNAVIRTGSVFYSNVNAGSFLRTGHNILVREKTFIGDNVLIGTNTVIDGNVDIGSNVSIQSNVYIPINSVIEDHVFLGPRATLTNDRYPIREVDVELEGAVIKKGASVGANAVILPGVEVGEGAIVGAGSVVTRDVPSWTIVAGNPAHKLKKVPERYRILNRI